MSKGPVAGRGILAGLGQSAERSQFRVSSILTIACSRLSMEPGGEPSRRWSGRMRYRAIYLKVL
jgi:hypothetical protein